MRQVVRDFQQRAEQSDFVAVIDDQGSHTARELLGHATELARALSGDAGVGTVLVQADNSWRTIAATLAVGIGGGVLAVVNRHTTGAEFAAAFEDIEPDAVVADPSAMAEWAVPDLLAGDRQSVLDGWVGRVGHAPRDISRWAGGTLIGLTSGSTGRAKGVVQSEEALRYASSCTTAVNGLRRGDAVAAVVPLSSAASFCFGAYLSLMSGCPLVLWDRWNPTDTLRRMAETNARWTMCVPTMALQLAKAAEGSDATVALRSMTVGGGPMDLDALGRAEEALGTRILRVFGMSECLGHTSVLPDEPRQIRLGRDGRPFPGTDVRAVDADGRVADSGHAQVRGPSLFLGYARGGKVEAPELTKDGFFPTGDLVMTNDDGTITIMGREKDVIIRGGRNIDITEVERAVVRYPRVAQVCVVPLPDAVLGERAAALIVSVDGGPVSLDEVVAHLERAGLSKFKWPEFVCTVEELPQTAVGKVSRARSRDLARDLLGGEGRSKGE